MSSNMDQILQSILSNSTSYGEKYDDDHNVTAATTKVSVHTQVDLGPVRKRKKKKVQRFKKSSLLHSSTSARQTSKSKSRTVVSNESSKSKFPAVRKITTKRRKSKSTHRSKAKLERSSSMSSIEDPAQNAAFLRKYFEESTRLANKRSSEEVVAGQSEIVEGEEESSKKKKGKNKDKKKPPWVDRINSSSEKSSIRSIFNAKKTSLQSIARGRNDKKTTSKHTTKKKTSSTKSGNKSRQLPQPSTSKSTIGPDSKNNVNKPENKKRSAEEISQNSVAPQRVNNNQVGGASTDPKKTSSDPSRPGSAQPKSVIPHLYLLAGKSPPASGQEEARKRVSFAALGNGNKVKPGTMHKMARKSMISDSVRGQNQNIRSKNSTTAVAAGSNKGNGENFAEMPTASKPGSADSNKYTSPHISQLLRINPVPTVPRPESATSKNSDVSKQFKNIEEIINSKLSGHAAKMKSIWEKTPYQPMTHARFRDMVSTYASPEAVLAFAKVGEHIEPMIPDHLQTIKRNMTVNSGPAVPSNLLTLPRPWEIKELLAKEENRDKTIRQLQGPPRKWQDSESTYNRINYESSRHKLRKEARYKALLEEVAVRDNPASTGIQKVKYPMTSRAPPADSSKEMADSTVKYFREAIYGKH